MPARGRPVSPWPGALSRRLTAARPRRSAPRGRWRAGRSGRSPPAGSAGSCRPHWSVSSAISAPSRRIAASSSAVSMSDARAMSRSSMTRSAVRHERMTASTATPCMARVRPISSASASASPRPAGGSPVSPAASVRSSHSTLNGDLRRQLDGVEVVLVVAVQPPHLPQYLRLHVRQCFDEITQYV